MRDRAAGGAEEGWGVVRGGAWAVAWTEQKVRGGADVGRGLEGAGSGPPPRSRTFGELVFCPALPELLLLNSLNLFGVLWTQPLPRYFFF